MLSSARLLLTCSLLAFGIVLNAQAQSGPDKASISGRITANGQGVAGAAVGLLSTASRTPTTPNQSITNEDGNYRITNVSPGTYRVMVNAPGFVSSFETNNSPTLLVSRGEVVEGVDLVLLRGGVITGKVTDSDGSPLIEEEIHITTTQSNKQHSRQLTLSARTDDRGIYRAYGIPPGVYIVSAGTQRGSAFSMRFDRATFKQTYYPSAVDVSEAKKLSVSEGSELNDIDIVLNRSLSSYSLKGKVIDGETGRPLANIGYGIEMFTSSTSSTSISNGSVTNKDGEFKWRGLEPGKYAINLELSSDTDIRAESVSFEVIDQDITNLMVKTSKGSSISGVIVFDGLKKVVSEALIPAQVYATVPTQTAGRGTYRAGPINPDGSFRITGLPSGMVNFGLIRPERFAIVRIERDGVVQSGGVELKDRDQITGVKLFAVPRNGTIRGTIKLAQGELPANARVSMSLERLGGDVGPSNGFYEGVTVGNRGQFLAEGVLPGSYNLHTAVYLSGVESPSRIKQQVVVIGGEVTDVTLTLPASKED